MERTIKVTGKGRIAVKPDTIRLEITQSAICKEYEDAIRESAEKKAALNALLAELGFRAAELKTLYYNIDAAQENYQAKDRSWQTRLLGYRYTHRMKLEFPADNALLGKVLYRLARCPGKPEFSIEHTVADPEAVKNTLLAKAVADAKAKAAVLAGAAGVKLGEIQLIDYSWGELEIVSRPMNMEMSITGCAPKADAGYDMDIEADDIDVTDTVTVVWEIG